MLISLSNEVRPQPSQWQSLYCARCNSGIPARLLNWCLKDYRVALVTYMIAYHIWIMWHASRIDVHFFDLDIDIIFLANSHFRTRLYSIYFICQLSLIPSLAGSRPVDQYASDCECWPIFLTLKISKMFFLCVLFAIVRSGKQQFQKHYAFLKHANDRTRNGNQIFTYVK